MTTVFSKECKNIKLKLNMKNNADVKTVQTILTKMKLYDGWCKGNFGPKTEASVKKFQQAKNITVDGIVGEETCTKFNEVVQTNNWTIKTTATASKIQTLNCDGIKLQKGSKGEQVKLLQTHLKTLGYYTTYKGSYLKIDGDFGKYTKDAVKEFQKSIGTLSVDGVVGEKTCPHINEKILAKAGITSSSSSSSSTKKSTSASSTSVKKVDPYLINTKNNVLKTEESNLHIQGINFIISDITFNTAFSNGNWSRIELMDGHDYVYQGRTTPRKYTITTYLKNSAYTQLQDELYKLQAQKCTVTGTDIVPGTYTVTITVALQKMSHKKLTIELNECI